MTEQFWLGLQDAYEVSRLKADRADELEQIKPFKTRDARV